MSVQVAGGWLGHEGGNALELVADAEDKPKDEDHQ